MASVPLSPVTQRRMAAPPPPVPCRWFPSAAPIVETRMSRQRVGGLFACGRPGRMPRDVAPQPPPLQTAAISLEAANCLYAEAHHACLSKCCPGFGQILVEIGEHRANLAKLGQIWARVRQGSAQGGAELVWATAQPTRCPHQATSRATAAAPGARIVGSSTASSASCPCPSAPS